MKWTGKQVVEAIGLLAVVFSLLLVAFEIRQANRIAVVNTEFELRNGYHAINVAILTDPGMVDFMVRMGTDGQALEGADAVRARAWIYLQLNSWVATALAYENDVTTKETYRNILDNIDNAIARSSPEMLSIWRETLASFPSLQQTPVFQRVQLALIRHDAGNAP